MFVTLRVYSLSIDNCFGATNHEWPDNRMCTDWHLCLNSLTCTTLIVETTESCQAQIHTSCFFSIILVYYGGLHSETTEFSQTPNCRSMKMMSDVDTRKVRKRLKNECRIPLLLHYVVTLNSEHSQCVASASPSLLEGQCLLRWPNQWTLYFFITCSTVCIMVDYTTVHSCTSLGWSFFPSYSFVRSFVRSFIHSFTHSLIHSR